VDHDHEATTSLPLHVVSSTKDVMVQTEVQTDHDLLQNDHDLLQNDHDLLQNDHDLLQNELADLKMRLYICHFRLSNIKENDEKIRFYTGFSNYFTLEVFYNFLGPAVNSLNYWGREIAGETMCPHGRNRSFPPM
jgi:hypothetical protein